MSHDPEQMTMANSVDRTTAAVVKGLLQNVESQRLGAGGNWAELYRQQWFHCVDVGAVQRGEVVPDLSPRRRNVINDPRLQQVLEQGDVPWQRGNIVEDPAVLALFENF
jgi:p70 ribosomal S6 kinase